jgi:hypothetical protein
MATEPTPPALPEDASEAEAKSAAPQKVSVTEHVAAPYSAPAQNVAAPDLVQLQSEIRRLREKEIASREAMDTLKTMLQARAARPQVAYLGAASSGAFTPPAPAVSASIASRDDAENARERVKLVEQLRQMETQLASEREQRKALEAELQRLRQETAVGPFADTVSEELVAARRKLQGLEAALASAQRARDDLAKKNEALKAQHESGALEDAETQAQIAALEQQQRETLDGLQAELAASQARENELRQALAATESAEADVSYALVGDLRAENAALKSKLQEAQQQNVALTGKLKAASRVADMLFKVRVGKPEEPDERDEPDFDR